MRNHVELGRRGEDLAAEYLEASGYEILDRNWHCRWGEIDLVAARDGALVCVEVKTRSSVLAGHPLDAITDEKLQRMRRVAGAWRRGHPDARGRLQLDVIAILIRPDGLVDFSHLQAIGLQ
ncbi:YraN family protein [Gulosibacter sp. 10]|uniref:YraN family protein n=1 Tax=Gulosibacter sp. 10 TaxID=1255570 RepID=UPI00097ECF60|nr:YraN family protein [Gulosibacter sp. 10]SJM68497.1 Endonuclease [Gulosibacter sp. 10]